MRELTILRNKTFIGCLANAFVYIEDANSKFKINGVPCRLLGKIKNGKEKTFQIENTAARVYVIANKSYREMLNDYYPIPEGDEHIYLVGQYRYELIIGNVFRFDNLFDEQALQSRRKNSRKTIKFKIAVAIVAFVLGVILGLFGVLTGEVEPQEFDCNGMYITLTNQFEEVSYTDFDFALSDGEFAVFGICEKFSDYEGLEDYKLSEYTKLLIDNTVESSKDIKPEKAGDALFFAYTYDDGNVEYIYYTYVYKLDDCFRIIQITAPVDNKAELDENAEQWIASVEFE